MKAIQVSTWGATPSLTTLPQPIPAINHTIVRVLASGLPQLVRAQAAGTHYSVRKTPLPYTPGVDGVGYIINHSDSTDPTNFTIPNGISDQKKLVFFTSLISAGAFAEYISVPTSSIVPLPEETSEDDAIKLAALINPAMSSWMALKTRARIDKLVGEFDEQAARRKIHVLVLGVTSVSGKIACTIARHLTKAAADIEGEGKEIILTGVARDIDKLEAMKATGLLDHIISSNSEKVTEEYTDLFTNPKVGPPHIVLDYVFGPTAATLLASLPHSASQAENLETRYVHIGSLGKVTEMNVPGPMLRSQNVVLSGSGPGSWSIPRLMRELPELTKTVVKLVGREEKGWRAEYGVVERRLEDVMEAWEETGVRSVFVMR